MTEQVMHPYEIECARRLDGHKYQKKHPQFRLVAALERYWETGNWQHLSLIEAMATMSLLQQALEAWQNYSYPPEVLHQHYQTFHSLYELLKDKEIPSD
jgi:hypothetical protein